jgi:metal-sulfur cluster biosynthetic enzyme
MTPLPWSSRKLFARHIVSRLIRGAVSLPSAATSSFPDFPFEAMAWRADLLDRLRQVTEPCSIAMGTPISIVAMGLIEDVELRDGRASVTLCLTDAACVHLTGMRQYITDVLLGLPGVSAVEVRQSQSALWTRDRTENRPA